MINFAEFWKLHYDDYQIGKKQIVFKKLRKPVIEYDKIPDADDPASKPPLYNFKSLVDLKSVSLHSASSKGFKINNKLKNYSKHSFANPK